MKDSLLWKNYIEKRDVALRDTLIEQHLSLVKYVVGRMIGYLPSHIKLDDLYSSGVTGLIRAVERYDISKKNKFETYAILLIKGAIIDELRKLDWIPRSVHKQANQIALAQNALQQKLGRDPTDSELAEHLSLSQEELTELLGRIRPIVLIPLNAQIEQEEEAVPLLERLADTRVELSSDLIDRKACAVLLENAIADLPEQERKVLILYYYEELMLKEIGKILGVSESRVSQIHTKAILKLRSKLKNVDFALI